MNESKIKKQKCLVIGANGFIGSHLVDSLVSSGFSVRALDTYITEPQFIESESIEIIRGSSFEPKLLIKALETVEYVFHAISATTPFTSDNDPYIDINQNLVHNIEIIERAVKAKAKKVIYISSGGAVYGSISEERNAREVDAPRPVSPYGINKLATEYYLEYFNRKSGLDYIVYRLTNPYGPRQTTKHHQGVIPLYLSKIKKKEKLTVFGDGSASRDYIYIKDAIKMVAGSFEKANEYPVYNIGCGEQTDLVTIINTIEKIMDAKAELDFVDPPKTFLQRTMVSNERFIEEFGIQPTTKIEDGIRTMLNT